MPKQARQGTEAHTLNPNTREAEANADLCEFKANLVYKSQDRLQSYRETLSQKKNDILNFACKWMKLENTILSEVTQNKKKMNMVCTHS